MGEFCAAEISRSLTTLFICMFTSPLTLSPSIAFLRRLTHLLFTILNSADFCNMFPIFHVCVTRKLEIQAWLDSGLTFLPWIPFRWSYVLHDITPGNAFWLFALPLMMLIEQQIDCLILSCKVLCVYGGWGVTFWLSWNNLQFLVNILFPSFSFHKCLLLELVIPLDVKWLIFLILTFLLHLLAGILV